MDIKIIKTQEEYEMMLDYLEAMLDKNPPVGSTDAHKIELLTLIIKDYEEKHFSIEYPTAIEAIKFRMEQEGLAPRDLIPYIGSRSKVSEVLSGKRQLTLTMIRALHIGLGIPLESLVTQKSESEMIDWEKFPIKEMKKRGWIKNTAKNAKQIINSFLDPIKQEPIAALPALLRQTKHIRSAREMDMYALFIWITRIIIQAKNIKRKTKYDPNKLTNSFFNKLAQLSVQKKGPILARKFLAQYGIILVVEPHFSRTYLDGVALMTKEGPVIGLTLRYDRLDNFWFCLFHELAHLKLHLSEVGDAIYDDLEYDASDDEIEKAADSFAGEMLIPSSIWEKSPANKVKSPAYAKVLAEKLNINVAIVAGRMRHHFKDHRILNNLIGAKEVRKYFSDTYED